MVRESQMIRFENMVLYLLPIIAIILSECIEIVTTAMTTIMTTIVIAAVAVAATITGTIIETLARYITLYHGWYWIKKLLYDTQYHRIKLEYHLTYSYLCSLQFNMLWFIIILQNITLDYIV